MHNRARSPHRPRPLVFARSASPRRFTAVLTASLAGLAGCGGSDPSDPVCEASSVTITGLAAVIQALENVQLSAQVVGTNCSSADVEWSASDGLEVSDQGTVRGVLLGGPFTVTASVDGVDGTAETTVATADVVADARWAVAWMNSQAATATITTNGWTTSTGGAVTSTRSGTGAYRVVFAGLGAGAGQREAVHVSAYFAAVAAPRRCRVLSKETVGSDLAIEVRCHDLNGTLADSRFDVLVTPAGSTTGRSAFLVSTSAQGGAVPATMAHNSVQGALRVVRESVGSYDVIFGGQARAAVTGSGPETFHVTAYGDGTAWCKVQSWGALNATDLRLNVLCFSAAGAPADATFSVLMLERERATKRLAFAWADQPSNAVAYAPHASYSYNSAGQVNQSVNSSAGVYLATWPGLARVAGSTAETNLVTAYGSDATYCQVDGWGNIGVVVRCFAPNGTPTDSQFNAIWIE